MQVDFYQLSRDPAEVVVPLLARNTLKAGERLLVVSADDALTGRISERLWAGAEIFLAHGLSGGAHDARQPILLADQPQPANGARYVILADGVWHEAALGFARAFLLFDGATIEAARGTWRALDGRDSVVRNFWRQDEGRWTKVL
ncbi:DNA polymerase III subunit chi [Novosphingobium sp.]|uniref:DNA polymerase III subunit chi n=1 Tax=Novosphingobium sp. TaxID=1874826 RepID=UPI0022BB06B5|nr:DNA polymerase III subunit chi [Novosphingobium sp.]MCZ8019417.1 DNA polymerase III subunit chi [Novosphingobium sp.]MCZ8035232.1 DNA polymerase III subunit chi [Novosphingobium sp.]MCZ8050546.1 DNA polymerase III subunit chi [Novosphingobium sp.]MCZ8058892.1 DNA polymerase III subunit chi [Novosphingobium sp.]MCZ8232337.1 DNA polymerase III subunit chi [Novosphingobium sp.]